MSSQRSTRLRRQQRRKLRNSPAARAARERKAALPWQRACKNVHELVAGGQLPPACGQVMDAMARCHQEHGKAIENNELLIGYGLRGDPARVEARARSTAEPPVHDGIADEAKISRRWAIACVAMIVRAGILRRWYGGPKDDYRDNVKPAVLQRAAPLLGGRRGERAAAGERRTYVQGIGGSGWANAYTVDGIPDPVDDRPPPAPEPPEAPRPPGPHQRPAGWQRVYDGHQADRLDRQRRRLREEEDARTAEPARGP